MIKLINKNIFVMRFNFFLIRRIKPIKFCTDDYSNKALNGSLKYWSDNDVNSIKNNSYRKLELSCYADISIDPLSESIHYTVSKKDTLRYLRSYYCCYD